MSETDLCDNQVQPLSEKVDLQRKTIDTLAAQLAAESQLKEAAEKALREAAAILGPPGTTSATASDVIKWANFAAIGLKIANAGLGEYRLRYEAAEARAAGLTTELQRYRKARAEACGSLHFLTNSAAAREAAAWGKVLALLAPAAEEGAGDVSN